MRGLLKFFRLPAHERFALRNAVLLLLLIRLGLTVLPLKRLAGILRATKRVLPRNPAGASLTPELISWAVKRASRYVPGGENCLARALTAKALLEHAGYPAALHIGVLRNGAGCIRAHAWVKSGERFVVGSDSDAEPFQPLLPLNSSG